MDQTSVRVAVLELVKALLVFQPVPGDGEPRPILNAVTAHAVSSVLGAFTYPTPDGDGPDPDGPWGPVIRDALIALTVTHLATRMRDRSLREQLQKAAVAMAVERLQQLPEAIG